jgi:hypothetical protein
MRLHLKRDLQDLLNSAKSLKCSVIEMNDLRCPYCDYYQEPDCDNREPNTLFEHECEKCEKIFGYEIEYYPSYTEVELPCANGEPHDWQPIRGVGMPEEYYKNTRRCSYCDETKTLKEGESWNDK